MWYYFFYLKENCMKKYISFFIITLLSTLIIVSNVTTAEISLCLDGCDNCQTRQTSDCCANMMESSLQQNLTAHSSSRDNCPQANFCGNHVTEVSFFILFPPVGFDEIDLPEQFIFPSLPVRQATLLFRSPHPPSKIKDRPLYIRNCSFLI